MLTLFASFEDAQDAQYTDTGVHVGILWAPCLPRGATVTSTRRRNGADRQARYRRRQRRGVAVLRGVEVDWQALGRAFVNAGWLAAHGLTNDRKGLLSDRRVRVT
jgi:hypothetical protein